MVAIDCRVTKSATANANPASTISASSSTAASILSPTDSTTSAINSISNQSVNSASTSTTTTTTKSTSTLLFYSKNNKKTKMSNTEITTVAPAAVAPPTAGDDASAKSGVSQRQVDVKMSKKNSKEKHSPNGAQEISKRNMKLDLNTKDLEDLSMKSPKSPISGRLPHQNSLTSSVDVEDRKTLREALYQGIFHRHRRTIFAVGSFLRMLRSRNSQYNTIRSSSEGETDPAAAAAAAAAAPPTVAGEELALATTPQQPR